MTKTCVRCEKVKDLSVFYKQTALRPKDDGYDYYCKECRNASAKNTWKNNKKKCSVEQCESPHYARTVCKCHYSKLIRQEKNDKEC
jgi:hypothetical protein